MRPGWIISFLFVTGMVRAADSGASAPAAITKEGSLVVVSLKPEAEARLRLKTVKVAKESVASTRLFSGEVVIPLATEGKNSGSAPLLGGTLDEVLRLAGLQAAADGRVLQAEAQVEAAKTTLERARKMLSADVGTARSVDDAKALLALAEIEVTTAKAQRALLGNEVGGNPRRWVRVAVFGEEAELLDAKAPASSGKLELPPVAGPPTANAISNTIDWYYELPPGSRHRAGERIGIEIPATDNRKEALVIPFKAVLYDIHGGQWVYAKTGEHAYTRIRIQVLRVTQGKAILASGPPAGTEIVTDGSAELFGTEFMTGK